MAGIRKEKFISWKLFIYRHPDCSTTEANSKIILLLTTLPDFNLGIPGGMTNIEMIFNPCLRVLKHVLGYHSHITYAGYQLLKIIVFDLVDEVRNYFTYMMPGGWFGKRTPIAWPLRSPDLTPLDCRESIPYVNNLVYLVKKPRTSADESTLKGSYACSDLQHASKHVDRVWIFSGYL